MKSTNVYTVEFTWVNENAQEWSEDQKKIIPRSFEQILKMALSEIGWNPDNIHTARVQQFLHDGDE